MLRCSPELGWEAIVPHLDHTMLRMQYSGYSKQFRAETLKSAIKAYKEIMRKDSAGTQPMYRDKSWNKDVREIEKRRKKGGWFKKGGNESVIFIPTTPGSTLKKKYQAIIKKSKMKIKVVERAGTTLKQHLQRSNPLGDNKCLDKNNCPICTGGKGGRCREEGINYGIVCEKCGAQYYGESARNGYTRGQEHMNELQRKSKQSVLWRHVSECHSEEDTPPDFTMKVSKVRRNDATLRQITEGVQISKTPPNSLINNKQEWNAGSGIVETVLTRM